MKKLVTKKDFVLLVVLLIVGFAGVFLANFQGDGKTAVIKVDGKVVQEISLQGEKFELEIDGVTICRENGEVFVTSSNCSDKICVHTDKISKAGEGIICAPNRVAIEIDGKSDSLPDAITG